MRKDYDVETKRMMNMEVRGLTKRGKNDNKWIYCMN